MKKSTKKLLLATSDIRVLTRETLATANGGDIGPKSSCKSKICWDPQ